MASFVNETDLRNRIGSAKMAQVFDDDGDGEPDTAPLQSCLADANDTTEGILLGKGFTRDQLNKLSVDAQIRRAASGIAAQIAGERRTEWLNDRGEGQYHSMGERAKDNLKALAAAELRSRVEYTTEGAGENETIKAQLSTGCPRFIIARDAGSGAKSGPGGF